MPSPSKPRYDPPHPRYDPVPRALSEDAVDRLLACRLGEFFYEAKELLEAQAGEIYSAQRDTAPSLPNAGEQRAGLKSLADRFGQLAAAIEAENYSAAALAAAAATWQYEHADYLTDQRVYVRAANAVESDPAWVLEKSQEETLRAMTQNHLVRLLEDCRGQMVALPAGAITAEQRQAFQVNRGLFPKVQAEILARSESGDARARSHPTRLVEVRDQAKLLEAELRLPVKPEVLRKDMILTVPVEKIVQFLKQNGLPVEDYSWESGNADSDVAYNESLLVKLMRITLLAAEVDGDPARAWIRAYKASMGDRHGIDSKKGNNNP